MKGFQLLFCILYKMIFNAVRLSIWFYQYDFNQGCKNCSSVPIFCLPVEITRRPSIFFSVIVFYMHIFNKLM